MGDVFINYRSGDNPWAAAGIHEWLAQRLTNHRVFRDCVSLDAGSHYPTAIMSQLEKADLVLAIIGPGWLTATHPGSGQRLIDRPDDWVHRELAFAFQHDIPVLPVLLKDTPDNAWMPKPADLPPPVRPLATVQFCEVSQRRLRADLTNLGNQILRLLPAAATSLPTAIPRETFYALADALEAIPCLFSDLDRAAVISQLRPTIAGAIRYHPQRRIHLVNIIRTCLDYEGGLPELMMTVRDIEGPESIPLRRLLTVVKDLPIELHPEEWSGEPVRER